MLSTVSGTEDKVHKSGLARQEAGCGGGEGDHRQGDVSRGGKMCLRKAPGEDGSRTEFSKEKDTGWM